MTPERFWSRVDKSGECWLWTGSTYRAPRNRTQYGHLRDAGKDWVTHRYAWFVTFGPIPPGKQVNHHCDTTLCCRPDHLYLGTQKENVADMDRRGRRHRPVMEMVEQLMEEWGVSQSTVFKALREMRADA